MAVVLRLIGPPAIERDGRAQPSPGRKGWGLLAYLLLETRAPTRRELAERLTSDADDPLAALRWHLLQIRRAIDPAEIVETSGRLSFRPTPETVVDVSNVLRGSVGPEVAEAPCSGELLEGLSFDDAPAFDTWLSLQRARLATACADVLRWSATMLSRSDPSRALSLIELGLLQDPFDDALHQLAVETHVARGDGDSATAHIERVRKLYSEELGVEPSPSLTRALERSATPSSGPSISHDVSAATLIDVARARLDAAEFDSALGAARRAASMAAASGDKELEARALMTLAGALIHTIHGRDHESFGLLGRAQEVARELEDPVLLADIERELGFIWLIDARYGAAESCLTRSMQWALEAANIPLAAKARVFRALCESDRTDYEGAERDLHLAMADLAPEEHRGYRGYARATLARVLVRTNRLQEARDQATLAIDEVESGGMHGSLPWALAHLGEATLLDAHQQQAQQIFERGFALALEFADPCWESLTLRGLALCAQHDGRPDDARAMLEEALARARRETDTYHWAEALILTELVELEGGSTPEHVRDALRLALSGPMPDFAERLKPYAAGLQTQLQTPAH
jgi:DNA-binding SARP family transcriptional activator